MLRTWDYSFTDGRLTKVEAPAVPLGEGGPTSRPTIAYTYETSVPTGSKPYGLLRTITQPDGGVIEHTYHPNGRGFQVIDPLGFAQTLEFDLFRSQTRFYDEKGRLTVYDYNDQGNMELMIRPDLSRESYTWNSNGYRLSKTDAYGLSEKYTYGSGEDAILGNVIKTEVGYVLANNVWLAATVQDIDANGALVSIPVITTYTYETRTSPANEFIFSKVSSIRPPSASDGRLTTYTYNNRGDMLTKSETIGQGQLPRKTSYVYNNNGLLTRVIDPRGDHDNPTTTTAYVTEYESFDGFGQPRRTLRWIEDNAGQPVKQVVFSNYNANGFLTWQLGANLVYTDYSVDDLGRAFKTTYSQPELNQAYYINRPTSNSKFDVMGNLVELQDAAGRVTTYVYDKRQHLVQTVNADGSLTANAFDATGTAIGSTDGLGHVTSFVLDTRDRVVETVRDDGTTAFATFNARGTPVSQVDPGGNETKFEYDNLGRLIRKRLPYTYTELGTTSYTIWQYTYDAVGNRTSEALGYLNGTYGSTIIVDRQTTYGYDSLNQLVKRVDPDPDLHLFSPQLNGPEPSPVWTFQYDLAGNLTSTQLRAEGDGVGSPARQLTDATFDGLNRKRTKTRKISATDQAMSTYFYDAVGNRTKMVDGRGAETVYVFDRWNRLVTQTDPDPDSGSPLHSPVHTYTYDNAGNVLTETLRDEGDTATAPDRMTAYTYDKMNRPLTVSHYQKDSSTSVLALSSTEYDAAGNVVAGVDPLGRVTRYQYDSLNRRTQTTDALGGVTSTIYDQVGNVAATIDTLDHRTSYNHDSMNRLVSVSQPDPDGVDPYVQPLTTYIYDFASDLVISYQGTGPQRFQRRVDYVYDALHRLVEKDEAVPAALEVQHKWHYSYDVAGNQVSMTDPANLVTQYGYDALGRMLTQTDPDPDGLEAGVSRTWTYQYDHNGNLIDSRLDTSNQYISHTSYVYDALNRQTDERRHNWQTGAVYSTSHTDYDVAGNVTKTTDPELRQTQFTYDGLNRLIDQKSLASIVDVPHTTSTYDAAGNLLTSTVVFTNSAENRTTKYSYDSLNRRLRTTDPLLHITARHYDAVGNLTAEMDALGHSTTYVYDNLNRRTQVKDSLNHVTKTDYDEVGNVTHVTDPNGNVTSYNYDGMNRLRQELEGLGGNVPTTTYTYDLHDHIDTIVDRLGRKRDLDYDARGNLLKERWKDPAAPQNDLNVLTFTYAPDDQILTVSGGASGGNYYYDYSGDPLRRLKNSQFNDGWGLVTLAYTYNLAGQVKQLDVTNDAAAGADSAYYQTTSYDAAGRLDVVKQSNLGGTYVRQQADFDWNGAGQVKSLTRNALLPNQAVDGSTIYHIPQYDAAGRQTKSTTSAGTNSLTLSSAFDLADRITSLTTTDLGGSTTSQYAYNNADELTGAHHEATGLVAEVYDLDQAGNRKVNGQVFGTRNRITYDGTYSYQYDAEGNLQWRSKTGEYVEYTWDYRNRLTAVIYRASSTSTTVIRRVDYDYDAFDRRITKSVDPDGDGAAQGTQSSDFIYADGNVLFTRTNNGTAIGVLTDRYLNAPGVDQVLSDEPAAGAPRWTVLDHEGSVRRLLGTNGNTIADFDYDAFGKPAAGGTTPAAVDFLFGYAGGVYDGETGLQYHQARYYDSNQGRFLGEDPSSFAGGDANLYRYANGDPVNNTDPTGLSSRSTLGTANLFGGGVFGGGIGSVVAAVTSASLFSPYSFSTPTSSYNQTSSTNSQGSWFNSSDLFSSGSPFLAPAFSTTPASAAIPLVLTPQQGRVMREQEETQRFYSSLPANTTVFGANSFDYRQRQQEWLNSLDGAPAIAASFFTGFAGSRLLLGEQRNPTLESAEQATVNNLAERIFGLSELVLNAAPFAPNVPVSSLIRSSAPASTIAPSRIATPYGVAIQEESAAALQVRSQIQQGATVYKGGVLGRSEAGASQFLATDNPLNPGYAGRYGIPPQNSNFDFIMGGRVRPGAPVITRSAPGIPPNAGGGIEGVVNPGGFMPDWFHMP